MQIVGHPRNKISFYSKRNDKENDAKNPISKKGERATLFAATAMAGLVYGADILFDAVIWGADDIIIDNILDKKNQINSPKKIRNGVGKWAALAVGFVAAVAAVYTIYKTPNVMYNGKVNAFTKGKDMDVYTKSNKVERELYDQMNDKAKNATDDEKKVLSQQYLKLKAAKNPTPDFVQDKIPK
jgi:hypothetical protein